MRIPVPALSTLLAVFTLCGSAGGALTVTEAPPQSSTIEDRPINEGSTLTYEKERNFRLEERRREQTRDRWLRIAAIAAPIALLLIGGAIYAGVRSRNKRSTHRVMMRELKKAEVRRRSGGPRPELDPRQW